MTRKQRNWAFWILVFSLNLIPLVAQGGSGKVVRKTTPKAAPVAKATPPSASPQPEVKPDVPPPQPKFTGGAKDFTLKELKSGDYVMDFDARVEGANPNNSAKLMGRIFADCKDYLEITHVAQAPGCGSNAAFKVRDKGGFQTCMKAHKEHKDVCSGDSSTGLGCVFLSDKSVSSGGALFPLDALGAVDIQLTQSNPNGNEDHQNVCENFTTNLHHIDQATITGMADSAAAVDKQARLDLAESQATNCIHSEAELKVAYHACMVMATLGAYPSKEECVKTRNFDRFGLQILSTRAKTGSLEELDEVSSRLITWASSHPKECKKAIEPMHIIAKRLATQKIKRSRDRDEDSDPMAGYTAANDALESAIAGAPCLDETGKLSEMQVNLQINQTEKLGELKGMYSMEYQQQYADLMANVQSNLANNCNSWEMDTSCSAATKDIQSVGAIGQMVGAANQKTAQSNAALCQMVLRSSNGMMAPPQCQQQGMGGMGMMGMMGGGYGNIGSSSYGFGRL